MQAAAPGYGMSPAQPQQQLFAGQQPGMYAGGGYTPPGAVQQPQQGYGMMPSQAQPQQQMQPGYYAGDPAGMMGAPGMQPQQQQQAGYGGYGMPSPGMAGPPQQMMGGGPASVRQPNVHAKPGDWSCHSCGNLK